MTSVSVCARSLLLVSPVLKGKQFHATTGVLPCRPTSLGRRNKLARINLNKDQRLRLNANLDSNETEGADASGKASSETREDDGGLASELSKVGR